MNVGAKLRIIRHIISVLNKQKFYRNKHFSHFYDFKKLQSYAKRSIDEPVVQIAVGVVLTFLLLQVCPAVANR